MHSACLDPMHFLAEGHSYRSLGHSAATPQVIIVDDSRFPGASTSRHRLGMTSNATW